jgi:hypothetical protein
MSTTPTTSQRTVDVSMPDDELQSARRDAADAEREGGTKCVSVLLHELRAEIGIRNAQDPIRSEGDGGFMPSSPIRTMHGA